MTKKAPATLSFADIGALLKKLAAIEARLAALERLHRGGNQHYVYPGW